MFPAPTTTASCVPASCTATISSAMAVTVFGSIPYSRSPRSASPDSFKSARRNWTPLPPVVACATSSALVVTLRARDGDASEPHDLGTGVGERLIDGLRRLVDPRLLDQCAARHRCEETLVQHAVNDLLTRRLR